MVLKETSTVALATEGGSIEGESMKATVKNSCTFRLETRPVSLIGRQQHLSQNCLWEQLISQISSIQIQCQPAKRSRFHLSRRRIWSYTHLKMHLDFPSQAQRKRPLFLSHQSSLNRSNSPLEGQSTLVLFPVISPNFRLAPLQKRS